MIWPPAKAWTSKFEIAGQVHFVAINYFEDSQEKWVVLMSVIDSNLVIKVSWSQLIDSSNWLPGWDEISNIESSELCNKGNFKAIDFPSPSADSGLTIPISKNTIRPWFDKI